MNSLYNSVTKRKFGFQQTHAPACAATMCVIKGAGILCPAPVSMFEMWTGSQMLMERVKN